MDHLSNEQLEAIVQNKYTPKEKAATRATEHVITFIQSLEIKEGTNQVPNYALYYMYAKDWQKDNGKFSKIGFLREFSRFFIQHRSNSERYFLLNIRLTKEFIENAKKWDEQYGRHRKSTKNKQKKEEQVPGII